MFSWVDVILVKSLEQRGDKCEVQGAELLEAHLFFICNHRLSPEGIAKAILQIFSSVSIIN